ncbi:MAG: hypothetical protein ACOX69_07375 [Coriobacteriales bacterium]|jgi:trigger factor
MASKDEDNKQIPVNETAGIPRGDDAPPIPEYELTSYDPVEFDMPKMSVSDEQVEEKMMEYAEQFGADYVPTKRKVVGPKENIKIDIQVLKDGEPVPNISSDDRLYTVGEGLMPTDFDREILGMNVGDTKEFDFDAPDFDDEEGKTRSFHAIVTVNKIMRKVTPEITDRWVRKYMPMYQSADEFKEQTRKQLIAEADRMIEQEKNSRSAYALASRFEGHIDDYFYETTRADLMASYEQQAKAQGKTLKEMLSAQGLDENTFSMMLMFQTREMLTQGFALDAWARHYNLEATNEDIQEVAKMMAPMGRENELIARLEKDPKEEEAFRKAALRYVANKDVTAKAKINYVDDPNA